MATPRKRKPRKPSEAEQHAAVVATLSALAVGQQVTCQVGAASVAIERLTPALVWWYGWLPGRPHGGKLDLARAADLVLRASGERFRAARIVRRSRRRSRAPVTMEEARPAATRCLESTTDYLARRPPLWAITAWREAAPRRDGFADLKNNAGWMFAHYGARKGEWPGELWFYGQNGVDPRGFATRPAWTDYPFAELGDTPGQEAPIAYVYVLAYDGNKMCTVEVEGRRLDVKAGYLYTAAGRSGEVPRLSDADLAPLVAA